MPYSFTKIEEDKTKTIGLVFAFLILFYFVSLWLIVVVVKNFLAAQYAYRPHPVFTPLTLHDSLWVFAIAFVVGYGHWTHSVGNLIPGILGVLKAEPLKKTDKYHQMLQNIIDEVSVATGGKKMEGVVVPTMAMNAFALADFQGRAVIGVTEGILARLTRAQIEAVVGHEAAHIVTGDCLGTTVTSSLFELYSGAMIGLQRLMRGTRYSSRGGGIIVLFFLIYALLAVTRWMGQLVRMFVSREREYRADAIAVRLTRDPLSLAEALYAIGYRWRGQGLPAEELQGIFIVNPAHSAFDEKTGMGADWFSTHPPLERRLNILLGMAHADIPLVEKDVDNQIHHSRVAVPDVGTAAPAGQWFARHDDQWQGPFDAAAIATLGWMRPETWVKRLGTTDVKMAYEDEGITRIVNKRKGDTGVYNCLKCKNITLSKIMYEGVEVNKCPFCHGVLVEANDVKRILIREEVGFDERIAQIAKGIKKEEAVWREAVINRDPATLLQCPRCPQSRARMMRMFYTEAYRVEIDKCFYCGFIWFDKDELEILQYLVEEHTQPETA